MADLSNPISCPHFKRKIRLVTKDLAERSGILLSLNAEFETGTRNLSEKKLNQLWNCLEDPNDTPMNYVTVDYITTQFLSLNYKFLI